MDENERKDINSKETEIPSAEEAYTDEVRKERMDKPAGKASPSVIVPTKKPNLATIISAIVAAIVVVSVVLIVLLGGSNNNDNSNNGDVHTHSFGNWTITKNATCKDEGEASRFCECGEIETSKIDKINTHTEVVDLKVESTCKENGKTEGKHCSVCGFIIMEQTDLPLANHTYDNAIDEKCNICGLVRDVSCDHSNTVVLQAVDPTCTTSGLSEGKKCSSCGEVLIAQTTIKAKGHNEVVDAAVAATCTTEGLTEGKHCSVCREVIQSQTTTPKQEHSYKFYKCNICGVENIPDQGLSFYLRNDNKYIVSVGTAVYLTTIVIPSSHNGLPVVQVGSFENSMVETLVLPDSIIILNTLGDMERLTNIYFDGSIDEWCSISLSPSYTLEQLYVKDLNDEYSKPTKVTVSSLRAYSLFRCSSLTEITILSGAEYIGEGALACCNNLTKVTIPETVSKIDVQAFYGCTALEEITIPSGVTSIQYGAFGACTKLTKMYFAVPEGWSVDSSILSNPYTAAEYIVEKGNFKFTRK